MKFTSVVRELESAGIMVQSKVFVNCIFSSELFLSEVFSYHYRATNSIFRLKSPTNLTGRHLSRSYFARGIMFNF